LSQPFHGLEKEVKKKIDPVPWDDFHDDARKFSQIQTCYSGHLSDNLQGSDLRMTWRHPTLEIYVEREPSMLRLLECGFLVRDLNSRTCGLFAYRRTKFLQALQCPLLPSFPSGNCINTKIFLYLCDDETVFSRRSCMLHDSQSANREIALNREEKKSVLAR
jgi:hypothetical protein